MKSNNKDLEVGRNQLFINYVNEFFNTTFPFKKISY